MATLISRTRRMPPTDGGMWVDGQRRARPRPRDSKTCRLERRSREYVAHYTTLRTATASPEVLRSCGGWSGCERERGQAAACRAREAPTLKCDRRPADQDERPTADLVGADGDCGTIPGWTPGKTNGSHARARLAESSHACRS
jgi:hypothetical protein